MCINYLCGYFMKLYICSHVVVFIFTHFLKYLAVYMNT